MRNSGLRLSCCGLACGPGKVACNQTPCAMPSVGGLVTARARGQLDLCLYLGLLLVAVSAAQCAALISNQRQHMQSHRNCDEAADSLLQQLTLVEKASQVFHNASAVVRLGLPAFNWWSEGIHGFKADEAPGATLFPVPLAMAASFDTDLLHRVAVAVSDEARAHDRAARQSGRPPSGLNLFAPNINILRDPRWGRACEVYGEDPLLTARLAVAFVRGLQGTHPELIKVGATCKHFAAHSLEASEGVSRHNQDALVDQRDLEETYLPAFKACVKEARVQSIMCAYNSVNGVPACANEQLLGSYLGHAWDFDQGPANFVVSDCGAVADIASAHHYNKTIAEAIAAAFEAGTHLMCDEQIAHGDVVAAVQQGMLNQRRLDAAVRRLLTARCRLGILGKHQPASFHQLQPKLQDELQPQPGTMSPNDKFLPLGRHGSLLPTHKQDSRQQILASKQQQQQQPQELSGKAAAGFNVDHGDPWSQLDVADIVGSARHIALAREAADKSLVLLVHREDPSSSAGRLMLPLDISRFRAGPARLAVMGPLADDPLLMLGTYYGRPSGPVITPLAALRSHLGADRISYSPCLNSVLSSSDALFQCTDMARGADVALVFVGSSSRNYNRTDEGLETPVTESEGVDRLSLRLPGYQENMVKAIARSGTPIVLVLIHGGPVDISPLLRLPELRAVLSAPYPGQQGGEAIADALLGARNPSGRIPVTWQYDNYTQLSGMTNMSMRSWPGRTYKYLQVPSLFPFGHGLSYTSFSYTDFKVLPCDALEPTCFRVDLTATNTGLVAGDDVILLTMEWPHEKLMSCTSPGASGTMDAAALSDGPPLRELQGFMRVSLAPGASTRASIFINPQHWMVSAASQLQGLSQELRLQLARCYQAELCVGDLRMALQLPVPDWVGLAEV